MMTGVGPCATAAMVAMVVVPDWSMPVGRSPTGVGMGITLAILGVPTRKPAPADRHYSSALQIAPAPGTAATLVLGGLAFSILQPGTPGIAFGTVFLLAIAITALAALSSSRAFPSPA